MSDRGVSPETLAQWRRQWRHVGSARVAELLASPAPHELIWAPGVGGDVKRCEAERWLEERDAELARQVEQAKAERHRAWWHSWINTAVAFGALIVAIIGWWYGN